MNGLARLDAELLDQDPTFVSRSRVSIHLNSNGTLWIAPEGLGEATAEFGFGSPIGIELYRGGIRVLLWPDINSEDCKVVEMRGASESLRRNT